MTWLTKLAASAMGYPVPVSAWVCLGLSCGGMVALALALGTIPPASAREARETPKASSPHPAALPAARQHNE